MQHAARRMFPYIALVLGLGAVTYAVSFGTLPPADFTWVNETEIQSVDPQKVTGVPEGRVINCLFEGLYRFHPETLEPMPALAERHTVSDDLKTYTFYLRPGLTWSDGSPLTAEDFRWSWMRFLHPENAAQYAYQLYYVKNAAKYNVGELAAGDSVEVEIDDRPPHPSGREQLFPRGTILRGTLVSITKPPEPELADGLSEEDRADALAQWKQRWSYEVEIDGSSRHFSKSDLDGNQRCRHVLFDYNHVGVRVIDERTLEVTLENPTPYFLQLMAFYPLYSVHRATIEEHGVPLWTKPENIVSSGPFQLQFRRIRDRTRMVKNPRYWNAQSVAFNVIDALAVNSNTTALNLYMNGQADWITDVPGPVIPILQDRADFNSQPMLTTYFYRLCVEKPPLDDIRVRQALNLAIDKRIICEAILRAGQVPARSLVPPGLAGYEPAEGAERNVERAKELLAQAGYPNGRGMPRITILYNTLESHRTIAERIQSEWKKHLGIDVELENQEWGVYLDRVRSLDYHIARAAWVGDYADPNTFLDMFVTGGENNETGWGDPEYDRLIALASTQSDPAERMATLHKAEEILMEELPIIPVYFYVSKNMVRPYVGGFHGNILDRHDIVHMSVDAEEKDRVLEAEGIH
ncbi:MAG: peptide ABC transporter substrate-binding protein [Pirellulales bacterium]